jgi:hypothetical protein
MLERCRVQRFVESGKALAHLGPPSVRMTIFPLTGQTDPGQFFLERDLGAEIESRRTLSNLGSLYLYLYHLLFIQPHSLSQWRIAVNYRRSEPRLVGLSAAAVASRQTLTKKCPGIRDNRPFSLTLGPKGWELVGLVRSGSVLLFS